MTADETIREQLLADLSLYGAPSRELGSVVRRAHRLRVRDGVVATGIGGLLILGVALPLALLSPIGGSSKDQPGSSTSSSVSTPNPSLSAPAALIRGTAQHDSEDGIFILTPPDWSYVAQPSGPGEPKVLFAIANYPISPGGDCAPTQALEALPAEGALAWALEYHDTQGNDFPPRPDRFALDPSSLANYECSASKATYMFRFQDAGRYFQVNVAFGDQAGDGVRDEMLASLSSLVVDRCPPAKGPTLVSEFGTLVPDQGVPGDNVTLSGPTGRDEDWFWAPSDRIEVWWSPSSLGVPEATADKLLLTTVEPAQLCSFSVTFSVPDVPKGSYVITVLVYSDQGYSGGFGLMGERTFSVGR
jgi:hypothetical protein